MSELERARELHRESLSYPFRVSGLGFWYFEAVQENTFPSNSCVTGVHLSSSSSPGYIGRVGAGVEIIEERSGLRHHF